MLKRTIVFTALAGLAYTVIPPAPAYAIHDESFCIHHRHTGSARSVTRSSAEIAARTKWRYVVTKHGHPTKILWSHAKNKSMPCLKKSYGYKCWAKANPCDPHTTIPGKGGDKEVVLGGVNLTPWCAKQYGSGFKAKLIGKTAGDWVCELGRRAHRPISVKSACQLNYGNKAYKAKALNWQDPYSWKCLGK
jgi:hypothetical protein